MNRQTLHHLILSLVLASHLLSIATANEPVTQATFNIEVAKNNLRARGISSSDCGLYTIMAAAHILGKDLSPQDTFGNLNVPLRPEGMSSQDVVNLLRANGLSAVWVDGLSSADLAFATTPMIIPLHMQAGANTQHWVTVCGMKDDKVALYDSVDLVSFRSRSEVDLLWSGGGLVVSAIDADASRATLKLQAGAIGRKVLFISLGCCIALVISTVMQRNRVGAFTCLAVSTCGLSIFIGMAMWRDRISPILVLQKCWQSPSYKADLPPQFVREIDSSPNTVLVDCRTEAAYAFGHIPGARNLPINASLTNWLHFAKETDANAQIVVYCQSADCGWAEVCHQRLKCLGLRSAILSGGFNRFLNGGE